MAAIAVGALCVGTAGAMAQAKKSAPKSKAKVVVKKAAPKAPAAENGLCGVHLFDNAAVVLKLYGTPNIIEPVGVGSSATGPVGGGGPGMGSPGMGGPGGSRGMGPNSGGAPGMGPGGGGGPKLGAPTQPSGAEQLVPGNSSEFGFGDQFLFQGMAPALNKGQSLPGGGAPPPMGGPGPNMGGAPSGGGGGFSGTATDVSFVRWIYNRPNAKYAFVLDKTGKVVQCEAVGVSDPKVRTNRGLSFGADFSKLIKTYGYPENYEISGDSIIVRFLQKNKVAFRLSRLDAKKPHVITGVVVAGGKA